jgi:hypothetical protein
LRRRPEQILSLREQRPIIRASPAERCIAQHTLEKRASSKGSTRQDQSEHDRARELIPP